MHNSATVRRQLDELVLQLLQIQSAVVVSAAALRRQNCELDEDIANVLQRSVADRIQDQIERLEGTLQRLAPAPRAGAESRYNEQGQQQ